MFTHIPGLSPYFLKSTLASVIAAPEEWAAAEVELAPLVHPVKDVLLATVPTVIFSLPIFIVWPVYMPIVLVTGIVVTESFISLLNVPNKLVSP